ncbi:MAG: hypothetical protein ACTTJD_00565 [Porphyromonadaceae bacterium]
MLIIEGVANYVERDDIQDDYSRMKVFGKRIEQYVSISAIITGFG